jgi:phenylacetate-CoA ligase
MSIQADKLVARLREEGLLVLSIPTNPPPPRGLRWVAPLPGIRTCVREVQYLFHLTTRLAECGVIHHLAASGLAFWLHTVPVVMLAKSLRKRVVLNYRGGKARAFLARWGKLALPTLRRADLLVVPSEFLQKVFAEHGLAAQLLPNIADCEMFTYRERECLLPRLLVTRHLEPMYNVGCILRAFAIVQRTHPDAELTIAGTGSEEHALRALASELRLDNVRFCGAMPNDQLPPLYAANDIFVNASLVDNFPGALLEAACSGLTIVTTGAGGIPKMITDRENGIVVGLNDPAALARGVEEVLADSAFALHLTRNAHAWVQQFAWTRVFPRLLECYGRNDVHPQLQPAATLVRR